jgi:hypothetical protein
MPNMEQAASLRNGLDMTDTRDLDEEEALEVAGNLCKLTVRYRKMLWIFGVPAIVVALFMLDGNLIPGVGALVLGIASIVVARSRRNPKTYPATRLLLQRPGAVDQVLVKDLPGITQMVLVGNGNYLALMEIENPAKSGEALDLIKALAPHVGFDYQSDDGKHFVHNDYRVWERF